MSNETNTNKMKTQINKSELFKVAWKTYRADDNQDSLDGGFVMTFGECLSFSWAKMIGSKSITTDLKTESVKEIFEYLENGVSIKNVWNYEAEQILTKVSTTSKSFHADIASIALENSRLSTKQAWCVAYEFKNVA
jgi:hypothetical protein